MSALLHTSRNTGSESHAELQSELLREKGHCDTLQSKIARLQRQLSDETDRAEEMHRKLITREVEVATLTDQLSDREALVRQRSNELELAHRNAAGLSSCLAESNAAREELHRQVTLLNTEVATTKRELASNAMIYSDAASRCNRLEEEARQAAEQLRTFGDRLGTLENELKWMRNERDTCKANFDGLKSRVTAGADNLARLAAAAVSDARSLAEGGQPSSTVDPADVEKELASCQELSCLHPVVFRLAQRHVMLENERERIANRLNDQMSRCGALEEELSASLADNATLASRLSSSEAQVSRLHSQCTSNEREYVHFEASMSQRLQRLSESTGAVNDWNVVEQHIATAMDDLATLREQVVDQRATIHSLKTQIHDLATQHRDDIESTVKKVRREIEDTVITARTDALRETAQSLSSKLNASLAEQEEATGRMMPLSAAAALDQTELAIEKGSEAIVLSKKYRDALQYTAELEKVIAHLRAELREAAKRYDEPASPHGPLHFDQTTNTTPRAFQMQRDLIMFLARALCGYQHEVKDLVSQRHALIRLLREAEAVLSTIEHQAASLAESSNVPQYRRPWSPVGEFRVAVIAVIAARRLLLGCIGPKTVFCAGTSRVRLPVIRPPSELCIYVPSSCE